MLALVLLLALQPPPPYLILHNGRIVTVDDRFSIAQAIAVRNGAIVAVGSDRQVLPTAGTNTRIVDLHGKTVLPGLIDSHTHPTSAAMTEFANPMPEMESVEDVLAYIRERAKASKPGDWIEVHQVFITRLKEQRYPTREELDHAAPENPVLFATGPDASVNSLALKLSGIGRGFKVTDGGPGHAEMDSTGEPTGILRGMTRYVKVKSAGPQPGDEDIYRRVRELFKDYNAIGLTSIADRDAAPEAIERYARIRDRKDLTVRMSVSHHIDTIGPIEQIQAAIRKVAENPLCKPDPMLQIVGIKTFLDGGMLTGSAYMRKPWGASKIYAITDPAYRGVLFIPPDRLLQIVRTTIQSGLQFTAHSVGDGAVHNLLDAYQAVNREIPIRSTRPCITHSNFMSKEAVELLPKLGVVVDIQPDWLYLDARTLSAQFGNDRLRWFQPLRSIFKAGGIVGGGSDHMQKIGSLRSVNPYNPFLGMWIAITRRAKGYDGQLHPEEALTREQAIRMYTRNNAYILFRENEVGSLEQGKRADMVVLDRDILHCHTDEIKDIKPVQTYLDGHLVYDGTSSSSSSSSSSSALQATEKLVPVQRTPWLAETKCLEMFSAMTQGPDGRIYAGTCNAEKIGACLIAFDPKTGQQEKLADMQQVCGEVGRKTYPQSKIHSQICFDKNGVAWFGTHSYEWMTLDQWEKNPNEYTGGHLVTYDTKTKRATDLGILIPHESIMSLALAESVGKVYCVMHPTGRFVVYDIATRKVTDKGRILGYPSRTTIALKDGRGYTFTLQGEVVRYDPRTDRAEKLPVHVPLYPGETDATHNNPFDLAVSKDEKRIYGVGWTSGYLFEYKPNDGPNGSIRQVGLAFGDETVPGERKSLNIAMKAGIDGRIYYAGYDNRGKLACYDPRTGKRTYLGRMSSEGKPIGTAADAAGTAGGMCVLRDGTICVADFDQHNTWFNLFRPSH